MAWHVVGQVLHMEQFPCDFNVRFIVRLSTRRNTSAIIGTRSHDHSPMDRKQVNPYLGRFATIQNTNKPTCQN